MDKDLASKKNHYDSKCPYYFGNQVSQTYSTKKLGGDRIKIKSLFNNIVN